MVLEVKIMVRVTVWNEFVKEQTHEVAMKIYPNGIHNVIADFLKCDDIEVRTAIFHDEECGLTEDVLNETDVLIWWGHMKHDLVPDEVALRVKDHVLRGMGFIVLHSGHHSKPFKFLLGTSCNLSWRVDNDLERIWTVNPAHPIAQGVGPYFELEREEVYCEPFGIPTPDEVVFLGWFEGGEVFRSGCTFYRENGKIFYFQPGHETFNSFYDENVKTIIRNAVHWATPTYRVEEFTCPHLEPIESKFKK